MSRFHLLLQCLDPNSQKGRWILLIFVFSSVLSALGVSLLVEAEDSMVLLERSSVIRFRTDRLVNDADFAYYFPPADMQKLKRFQTLFRQPVKRKLLGSKPALVDQEYWPRLEGKMGA